VNQITAVENQMATHKVLLIDDEASIQKICSLYLEAEGFVVKALSQADNVLDEATFERPDVIIMDLNLPGVDGFSATKLLKQSEETSGIPVLVISARSETADKRMALVSCNADDYMTKPFDPDELVARVTVLIRRRNEANYDLSLFDYLGQQVTMMQKRVKGTFEESRELDNYIIEMIDKEFRKPIKVIGRIARKLVGRGTANPEIGRLVDEAEHLRQLVDMLVELRHFRSGELPVAKSRMKLGQLVRPVVTRFEEIASERKVNFTCNCSEDESRIRTNPDRLRRTISLLLQQAMEGERASSVALSIARINGHVEFKIAALPGEAQPESIQRGGEKRIQMPLARHMASLLGGILHEETGGTGELRYRLEIPIEPLKKGA
jgi:DNA-binding response OmpR family regulator